MAKLPIKYFPMSKKITLIIFSILIISGIFLRFYNLRNTQFTWDQENVVAFPAKDIAINHHFTLIGGKASVGNLYLGPLYSYLAAISFAIFDMDPVAGAVLAVFLSVCTLISGFLLVKNLFDKTSAIYFAAIYSISTLVIYFDRIPWNVNLLPFSSLLVFSGLLFILENKKKLGWFFVGLGLFIGFNSQFSVVLFIWVILIFLLLNKKIIDRSIFIAFLFLILAVFPLVIFETRHGFTLVEELFKFTSSSITGFNYLMTKIIKSAKLIFESIGRIFLFDGPSWIQQMMGLLSFVLIIFLAKDKKTKNFLKVYILYLFVFFVNFSFYSGPISEYYYIALLPVSVIVFSLLFTKIQERFKATNYLLIISLVIMLNRSFVFIQKVDSHSLLVKQNLISKIKELSSDKPVAIVYDMELGWSYGYDYLLDYYKVKKTDRENTTNIFWLSYPQKRFPGKADYIFGDFALGLPKTSHKILNTKDIELYSGLFKVRIPKKWQTLQCEGVDYDKYLFTPNLNASCSSYDKETIGILVFNIPNCNIWEMPKMQQLKIPSQLNFYIISGLSQNNMFGKKDLIATSFERERCVIFIDLEREKILPLSSLMFEFLENARR